MTRTGQPVHIATTRKHAPPLYACGMGLPYPLPHLVTEHHQLCGAKDFPCLHNRRGTETSMQVIEMRRKISFCSEEQLYHREGKFWETHSLPEGKDACLYFQYCIFSAVRKSSCRQKFKLKLILLSLTALQKSNFRKNL